MWVKICALSRSTSDRDCAPLQAAAKALDAAGTRAFRGTWATMAGMLCDLAEADAACGRMLISTRYQPTC